MAKLAPNSFLRLTGIALVSGLICSCASTALPPHLSPEQAARLKKLPLKLRVGVEPSQVPVYSEKLAEALSKAGIFEQVAPLGSFAKPPDLIARVEKEVHGTAVIPALTFLTGGLVPTVVEESHGNVFSLSKGTRGARRALVDASYRGTTTLGWAALGTGSLPGFTLGSPEESERFKEMTAYRTLRALEENE
jgi:hypothetical protein